MSARRPGPGWWFVTWIGVVIILLTLISLEDRRATAFIAGSLLFLGGIGRSIQLEIRKLGTTTLRSEADR